MRNIGQFEKQKQDNTILTDFSNKIRKKHQLMQKNNTDYTGMPNDLHRELLDGCHIRDVGQKPLKR